MSPSLPLSARVWPLCTALALAGCGSSERDCSTLSDPEAADACSFAHAVACAEADDLSCASRDLARIADPTLRAYATEKVLVVAPTGLTPEVAERLCTALDDTAAAACLRSYSRPHLWTR